jgi:hypothetical protein
MNAPKTAKPMPMRVHFGLALAALWPILLAPTQRMVGHPDADVWNHAWGPWWFWQQLSQAQLPWQTDWLYAPHGGVLWFIDPIAGLLGMVPAAIFGLFFAFNFVLLLYLTATSWAVARLAERMAGPGLHCLAASVALLFGPYLLSEVNNGISEACNLAPCILALTAAHDAMASKKRRHWLILGLLLGLTALGSLYYLLGCALVLAVWIPAWALGRPGFSALCNAAAGLALAAALILPTVLLMRASVFADSPLILREGGAIDLLQLHNAVDPRTYFWPGGFQSVDLQAQGEAFLHSGYLGWIVLGFALIGIRKSKAWAWAIAIVFLLIMGLGTRLYWGEGWVTGSAGHTYSLPFQWLSQILPAQAITHALRVAMPALVLLSARAAVGLAGRSKRFTFSVIALIPLEMIALGGSPWPPPRTAILDFTAAEYIAQQPNQGAVLDLPGAVGNTMRTSSYLVFQSQTQRPIPYRPDARAMTSALVGDPTFALFALASEHRPNHRPNLIRDVQRITRLRTRSLADRGVQWIVVHRDLEQGQENTALTETMLEKLFGPPKVFGTKAVYKSAPLMPELALNEAWLQALGALE